MGSQLYFDDWMELNSQLVYWLASICA